jgi:hypothetical protein
MRFLIVGLVLVSLAIGLSEYARRHPASPAEAEASAAAAAARSRSPLLETEAPTAESPAAIEPFAKLLEAPGEVPAQAGFEPVLRGPLSARALRGGFGAVLFVVDDKGSSAIVRAVAGEEAKVVTARTHRISAMEVDGSTVFFAEGGTVWSLSARGDEAPQVRVRFKRAVVTSLAPVGDTVFVTLMPSEGDVLSEKPVGAVVKVGSDGEVQLVAGEQARPSSVVADGKDVFWVSGAPGALWRAPVDGSFSSRVADEVEGPLALDADGVVLRATGGELRRMSRAPGAPVVLSREPPEAFIVSSGLVRFITRRALFEVVAGGEPKELLVPGGTPRGVAVAGTSLYVLVASENGSTLYAK